MNTRHLFLACALCIPLGLSAQNMITTGSATSLGNNTYQLTAAYNDQGGVGQLLCVYPGAGYATQAGDGYDNDEDINPGDVEILDNGVDDNRDGLVDGLPYCTPFRYHPCEGTRITNVTFADINNSSNCGSGGYSDFTALSASLEPGTTYTISISCFWGNSGNARYASVYVDWNRDGDFEDSGERVSNISFPWWGYPGLANISIPGNATGSYTMRVILDFFSVQNSCTTDYGEAEDYMIQVTPLCPDMDGDGYYPCHGDCDDTKPDVHHGATEICDGIDNNCNGTTDEGLAIVYYTDADGDGYGATSSGQSFCANPGAGYATQAGDCNDTNPNVYPGDIEILDNGIDDNCDGLVDVLPYCTPFVPYPYTWITNVTLAGINNSSGFGSAGYSDFRALSASLEPGTTYTISISGGIYDDQLASVYVDWNRNGSFEDSGERVASDIYLPFWGYPGYANIAVPGNATGNYTMRVISEYYYSYYYSNSCYIEAGEAEDYTIQIVCPSTTYYRDSDDDSYGNPAVSTVACAAPNGFVANNGDCDDGDASVNPGAAEVCDGKDNDCDGQIDETVAISSPWSAVNVGIEAQGSSWFDCTNGGTFTLNAKGYTTTTIDVQHSVCQTLCGNGDIIAHVASISTQGGWAGIQMRESASQGAKKFTLKTQLNTNNRREARTATNGPTNNLQIQRPFTYNWLRITRSGNLFAAYLSVDGVNWGQPVSSTTMTMNSCIQVGLFVESTNNTITTQATFNNVFISGGYQPLAEAPITQDVPDMEMAHEVSLFPNPSTGELNINLASYVGRAVRLEIYSLQGQLLYFAEIPEVQTTERLDLSAYPSGMYLVKVKSEGLPDVSKRLVLSKN